MMDNATNNDTLVDGIEDRCKAEGIKFTKKEARLRCMPHTVHLAALKVCYLYHLHVASSSLTKHVQLLEAIGAISSSDSTKAAELSNYQDSVTEPVARQHDGDAALQEDAEEDEEELAMDAEGYDEVVPAVRKVCPVSFLHDM